MILITVTATLWASVAANATAEPAWQQDAQTIIGALDYVAIDYPEAVHDGAVINAAEYAEQLEFLASVSSLLSSLPPRPEQESLVEQAQALAAQVESRAPASQVASVSRELAAQTIKVYRIATAPRAAPDPAGAGPLYAERCATCHGPYGRGNGPVAETMNPVPTNFHDDERAQQRSLYGLYSTITLGVPGTSMPSFATLTESQRWALAFYVSGLRDDAATIAEGERLWGEGVLHEALPTLGSFTSRLPTTIAGSESLSSPVLAYLRHHPGALEAQADDPIERAIRGLQDAVSAYTDDDRDAALRLALAAYLDGYELIEAPLSTLDRELATAVERNMLVVRNMIRDSVPTEELSSVVDDLRSQLEEAASVLSASSTSAAPLFVSAFLILLREGLEAILLLAAMSLYLRRTEHSDAMRYLHFGWVGALTAGALTWIGIKTAIDISGAQREVIEGTAALLAAVVLLYVGIWLHRHSNAVHWQAFLRERLGRNLSTGTLWGIAALAFVAVYREILETVLFYETLWLQSGKPLPLISGATSAVIALIVAGWLVFRVGARLPLRRFFQFNGALMFVLAFIFTGKGIMALQEAGWIGATFIRVPRIDWLGIYPTIQTVGTQIAIVCVSTLGLIVQRRKPKTLPSAQT